MSLETSSFDGQCKEEEIENSQEPTVKLIFVTNEMSDDMKIIHLLCPEEGKKFTEVISEEHCRTMSLRPYEFTWKKIIFVFENFDYQNEAFQRIFKTNTLRIYGLNCMLTHLMHGTPIPAENLHVCNLSMLGVVAVADTTYEVDEVNTMKRFVEMMGGSFFESFTTSGVTHFIADKVTSESYQIASEKNIPVMHHMWLKTMWNTTKSIKVVERHNFENIPTSFKLPILYKLKIGSADFNEFSTAKLKKLVEANGGNYNKNIEVTTDIIIMKKQSVGSEIHGRAIRSMKTCVSPEWLFDSLKLGFTQPFANYQI